MRSSVATMVAATVLTLAPPARALPARECVDASVRGQELRDAGQLRAAVASFGKCGDVSCPDALRRECIKWLEQTESRMPTFAVAARDSAGNDVVAATLSVDGAKLVERLDGKSRALDPGVHRLVVEASGYRRFERELLLREGEQRLVDVVLERNEPVAAPPAHAAAASEAPRESGNIPLAVPIFAAVSAAGIASGVFFLDAVDSEVDVLEKQCAPSCSDDEVGPLRNKVLATRVSFVVAIVAAGAATWFWLTRGTSASPPAKGQTTRAPLRPFTVTF